MLVPRAGGPLRRRPPALRRCRGCRYASPSFAEWQRRSLAGERLEAQLAWWRERLAGLPTLDLPLDHPRPAVAALRAASWRTASPPGARGRSRLSAGATAPPSTWCCSPPSQALLSRLRARTTSPSAPPWPAASAPEVEGLIGFFVNTLVLRADLAGDPPFAELLARVREGALGAWAHQDLPFEVLVEELAPERHLSLHPLFQVVFSLQDLPPGFDLPGLRRGCSSSRPTWPTSTSPWWPPAGCGDGGRSGVDSQL